MVTIWCLYVQGELVGEYVNQEQAEWEATFYFRANGYEDVYVTSIQFPQEG